MAKASRRELLARLRGRAKHGAKSAVQGGKATLMAAAAGGAAGYVVNMESVQEIGFIKDNWWALPVVMIGAGHFMKRRPALASVGMGLCGAGGYALAQEYQQQAPAEKSTSGAGDVSDRVFGTPGNAGALMGPGQGYGPVAVESSGLEDSAPDAGALQSDADTLAA